MAKTVFVGDHELTFPGPHLGVLRDCNAVLGSPEGLHEQIAEDGYLLVRGLINREKIIAGRRAILEYAEGNGKDEVFKADTDIMEAVAGNGSPGRTMGAPAVTHHPDVQSVLEGDELFKFFRNFFGGDTRTFDYKWLRFVRPDGWSGPHFDFVYMGRGSKQLHTCWVPFGDVPATMGTLTVLVGSHNLPSFAPIRDTYGRTDVDKDGTPGHFGRDPMEISDKYGGEWKTADFEMGDVIIFTMHTMHTSTKNLSDRWRISCDIRFQPAAHPIDERWVGKNPISHTGSQKISFEEAKKQWGLE